MAIKGDHTMTDVRHGSLRKALVVLGIMMIVSPLWGAGVSESVRSADIRVFPEGGFFSGAVEVFLDASDPRGTIVYTTDGTTPTADALQFSESILLDRSTTLTFGLLHPEGTVTGIGRVVYLITPGDVAPVVSVEREELETGQIRFSATADANFETTRAPRFRWYVDGVMVPGATESTVILDIRERFARTATVEVHVDNGIETTVERLRFPVAALPSGQVQPHAPALAEAESETELVPQPRGPRPTPVAAVPEPDPNRPPTLSLFAPFGVLDYEEPMTLEARAEDPDGDLLTFTWVVDGVEVQTGTDHRFDFVGTPEVTRPVVVEVAVTDGEFVRRSSLSILVNEFQPEGRISQIRGDVQVRNSEGTWLPAQVGMALRFSDLVSTGFDSAAIVALGDASVVVEPLSRLSIDTLERVSGTQITSLFMPVGRVSASVDATAGTHSFEVVAPHATASVRGTEFSFDGANIRVESGAVAVFNRPAQRNIQADRTPPREPVSADAAEDEDTDTAAEDAVAETGDTEAVAEAADDEAVLVSEGETATVTPGVEGVMVAASDPAPDAGVDAAASSLVSESRIPSRARVNVQLQFVDAIRQQQVQEGSGVLPTTE